jgi:hypothetical protein
MGFKFFSCFFNFYVSSIHRSAVRNRKKMPYTCKYTVLKFKTGSISSRIFNFLAVNENNCRHSGEYARRVFTFIWALYKMPSVLFSVNVAEKIGSPPCDFPKEKLKPFKCLSKAL